MTRLALTPQAKLYEEVAHTFTVSIAATIPSYLQLVPMASGIDCSLQFFDRQRKFRPDLRLFPCFPKTYKHLSDCVIFLFAGPSGRMSMKENLPTG